MKKYDYSKLSEQEKLEEFMSNYCKGVYTKMYFN